MMKKIEDRSAQICVLGLGYVGLPMCIEFVRAGFHVTGIDNDAERVKHLQQGHSYILDVSDQALSAIRENFTPTTDFGALRNADAIIICVPTPLRKTKDPDLSYILAATVEIAKHVQRGQIIILESTTYPGTTDEIILQALEKNGLHAGTDFYLAFSPERIDPGNKKFTLRNTPKIVGGVSKRCGELAEALYSCVVDQVVRVSSTRAAEMVKLLENTFRAINIGMVNEVAIMCDRLGIDTWEVIDAAATKPFGYMPFYPGPGLGGHCIPIDPHYLSWKLKTLNYSARFIELAQEINSSMPSYVAGKIGNALNVEKKSINGSKIVLIGMAYKKNSNDARESPAVDICNLLSAKGADIAFHDPYISDVRIDKGNLRRSELNEHLLDSADCVVIVTDHDSYDWEFIVKNSRCIVDTRNATRGLAAERTRIVKL